MLGPLLEEILRMMTNSIIITLMFGSNSVGVVTMTSGFL